MRASPLFDMVCHCQPTVTRAGSATEGVEQVSTTSFPIGPVSSDEAVIAGAHVHVRPAESVTVRPAITPPANLHERTRSASSEVTLCAHLPLATA